MGDNLLDALTDAFDDSDEDENSRRRSSILTNADKSMFYKSAVEDQPWLHSESGDDKSIHSDGSPSEYSWVS